MSSFLQLFSLILIVLMLAWESKGVRISDLHDRTKSIDYRNYIYSYVGIALLTILYSIGMTILGCGEFEVPAGTV